MRMIARNWIFPVFIGLFIHTQSLEAQPSLSIVKKREIGIVSGLTAWSGLNFAIQLNSPAIPQPGWNGNKNFPDNKAYFRYNDGAKIASDAGLLLTACLSGLSLHSKSMKDWAGKSLVMTESAWMAANLTHSVKMLARRNRPYTQSLNFSYSKRDDVYSFFSGHSALAASLVTSAILMNRGNTTTSNRMLAGAGILTAASTVYLRFYSGKHYPSDILAGIISGMGIAYLNFKIHEN